jgi:hypothetical protein
MYSFSLYRRIYVDTISYYLTVVVLKSTQVVAMHPRQPAPWTWIDAESFHPVVHHGKCLHLVCEGIGEEAEAVRHPR